MAAVAIGIVGLIPRLDVKQIMKDFHPKESDSKTTIGRTALAACYGKLTKEYLKKMDQELKIAIAGTVRELGELKTQNQNHLTWDNVLSCMMQNPLLELTDDKPVNRSDKLVKEGTNWFKFDGSAEKTTLEEVRIWFKKLIKDTDVLQDTLIDTEALADIVAQTGAAVTNILNLFGKHEVHEKTVLDVGILRYPDTDHPYFKVYRIHLKAWSDCTRVLFVQSDTNGITGTFNSRNFKPRDEVIQDMNKEVREQATEEANNMFD